LCAYDEELESKIDDWVKTQLADSPELGAGVIEALKQVGDGPAPE
jgi:hypothetical protein